MNIFVPLLVIFMLAVIGTTSLIGVMCILIYLKRGDKGLDEWLRQGWTLIWRKG